MVHGRGEWWSRALTARRADAPSWWTRNRTSVIIALVTNVIVGAVFYFVGRAGN